MALCSFLGLKMCKAPFLRAFDGKNWQTEEKNAKISIVENAKIFNSIFRGYALLFLRRTEGTQTCPKHPIFIFCRENGISERIYPLNLAKSESDQKQPKTLKNPKIGLIYWFQWAYMVKIIQFYVGNQFWDVSAQKVLIKKNFPFFH